MTPDQIALVRTSFADVQPVAAVAAVHFYARLFELDPALRPMFSGDMTDQGRKLMAMLGTAVGLLEHPDQLDAALQRLGQRHASYGVQPRHYDTVGRALLDTLAALLGERFSPPLHAAWAALYGRASTTMLTAAAAMPPGEAAAA
jgi:methyl-accepting chemotaxis protein